MIESEQMKVCSQVLNSRIRFCAEFRQLHLSTCNLQSTLFVYQKIMLGMARRSIGTHFHMCCSWLDLPHGRPGMRDTRGAASSPHTVPGLPRKADQMHCSGRAKTFLLTGSSHTRMCGISSTSSFRTTTRAYSC
jgi:hypothetical protein